MFHKFTLITCPVLNFLFSALREHLTFRHTQTSMRQITESLDFTLFRVSQDTFLTLCGLENIWESLKKLHLGLKETYVITEWLKCVISPVTNDV